MSSSNSITIEHVKPAARKMGRAVGDSVGGVFEQLKERFDHTPTKKQRFIGATKSNAPVINLIASVIAIVWMAVGFRRHKHN